MVSCVYFIVVTIITYLVVYYLIVFTTLDPYHLLFSRKITTKLLETINTAYHFMVVKLFRWSNCQFDGFIVSVNFT